MLTEIATATMLSNAPLAIHAPAVPLLAEINHWRPQRFNHSFSCFQADALNGTEICDVLKESAQKLERVPRRAARASGRCAGIM